jgi:hypothetical protein
VRHRSRLATGPAVTDDGRVREGIEERRRPRQTTKRLLGGGLGVCSVERALLANQGGKRHLPLSRVAPTLLAGLPGIARAVQEETLALMAALRGMQRFLK